MSLGGFSAPLLFLTFAYVSYFQIILYSTVFMIGVLVANRRGQCSKCSE